MDRDLLTALEPLIAQAIAEDIGPGGDVTSRLFLAQRAKATLVMRARQSLVAAGVTLAARVFARLDAQADLRPCASEGEAVAAGAVLLEVRGNARALLTAERTALNLCQRASAVATLTRTYVDAVAGTRAVILDTRKTMPGLRALDKYAVRTGGGRNHRLGLWDMILVKDNHIALAGGMEAALARIANDPAYAQDAMPPVVIECDTLDMLRAVLAYTGRHPQVITRALLDNMDNAALREAVAMARGRLPLEASGNMTLERVRGVAETGVDFISVGRLTHSAPAVDIGLDFDLG